jgi:hypothetical protein
MMLNLNNYGWLALLATSSVSAFEHKCERLKATLTYTQEEAPRDLSSVVSDEGRSARANASRRQHVSCH